MENKLAFQPDDIEAPIEYDGVVNYFMSSLVDIDPFIFLHIKDRRESLRRTLKIEEFICLPRGLKVIPISPPLKPSETCYIDRVLLYSGYTQQLPIPRVSLWYDQECEDPGKIDHTLSAIIQRNLERLKDIGIGVQRYLMFTERTTDNDRWSSPATIRYKGSAVLDTGFVFAPYIPMAFEPFQAFTPHTAIDIVDKHRY